MGLLEEYGTLIIGVFATIVIFGAAILLGESSTLNASYDVLESVTEYPIDLTQTDGIYITYNQSNEQYIFYINGMTEVKLKEDITVEITEGEAVLDKVEDAVGNVSYVAYVPEEGISTTKNESRSMIFFWFVGK